MPKSVNRESRWQRASKGSVQAEFVRLRAIARGVLCLASAVHEERREYRAVIEVSSANFTLQAEEEQELVIAGYRAFLKALSFPIQILLRSQQLDLTPYLRSLREAGTSPEPETATAAGSVTWQELAAAHEQFVRELASRRTLLEHRFYIVLPSDQGSIVAPHPLTFTLPFTGRGRRTRRQAETLEKAQQQLDLRAEVVMQQLAAIGLHCHRLDDEELYALYASCLTPRRVLRAPLPPLAASSVERPTKVRERGKVSTTPKSASPSPATPQPGQRAIYRQQSAPTQAPAAPQRQRRATDGLQEVRLPQPHLTQLADLLAPASVEVSRDALCLEGEFVRALAVTGFPREVFPGWLAPLLLHDEICEIVMHIHPQDNAAMLRELLRRKNLYQSSRRVNLRRGRMDDPQAQVAEQDVDALIGQLASGEERVFEVSLYILVRAADRRTLDERSERMLALLSNLFLLARPATFEHARALRSFLPEARNELMRTFTLDSSSLATAFPFISNALFMPTGVLVGVTPGGEPVAIDEWDESMDNPHEFCGAVSGAGKSYFYKLRIMRELLRHRRQGLQVVVIDPEKEYEDLCRTLGGDFVRLAPGSQQHLNPFDLLPVGSDLNSYLRDRSQGDRLADKVQGLHALFDIMLADRGPEGVSTLSSREKGLLDRAIYETYRQVGITTDPRTHGQRVPL